MRTILLVLATVAVTVGMTSCASSGPQSTLNGEATAPAVVY
ncbi:hypothetical protein BH09VER1_BH09VER1_37860 [soil metagenome]